MNRIRSWARSRADAAGVDPFATNVRQPTIPLQSVTSAHADDAATPNGADGGTRRSGEPRPQASPSVETATLSGEVHSTPSPPQESEAPLAGGKSTLKTWSRSFYRTTRMIILSSWLNILLVFVPVGIAMNISKGNPTAVFAVNALAIIPLAGLLSFATEAVARKLGDMVGALMNVTFGNAVELIVYIALVKGEIRIVKASLIGSILENLLLILGMCFLFGGLRFREQIYNSTVTQMSACLLSLSVTSLLLPVSEILPSPAAYVLKQPNMAELVLVYRRLISRFNQTAFHASFTDVRQADRAVLKVSRGTSVILLITYVIYLLFQLKSHTYIYQSVPQEQIDEESHPGVLANIIRQSSRSSSSSSSSSSTSSGSSSNSDSDATAHHRFRRVLPKSRRRRKSSASSKNPSSGVTPSRRRESAASATAAVENAPGHDVNSATEGGAVRPPALTIVTSCDEADADGEVEQGDEPHRHRRRREKVVNFDGVMSDDTDAARPEGSRKRKKKKKRRQDRVDGKVHDAKDTEATAVTETTATTAVPGPSEPMPKAELAPPNSAAAGLLQPQPPSPSPSTRRPLSIRNLSIFPRLPRNSFSAADPGADKQSGSLTPLQMARPDNPYNIRRTHSLPDRLNRQDGSRTAHRPPPFGPVNLSRATLDSKASGGDKRYISSMTAVALLIVSTSLVAVCAEALVDSINELVEDTGISAAFVGLIILPIVSNAAEHITAVTVASKNKMDLAIGVAVGSSLQIALFVTPVIMILGWILGKEISLYFTIFETISLFVSAFLVNYLVLDGRSNYLEGTLLIAAYVIIALAAFYYPDSEQQSAIGGGP